MLRVKTSNPIVRTLISDEIGPIVEQDEVEKAIAKYFEEVYAIGGQNPADQEMDEVEEELKEQPSSDLFGPDDLEAAIRDCNFNKGLGPDGFDGNLLAKQTKDGVEVANPLADALRRQILLMLN